MPFSVEFSGLTALGFFHIIPSRWNACAARTLLFSVSTKAGSARYRPKDL